MKETIKLNSFEIKDFIKSIVDTVKYSLLILDTNLKVLATNKGFLNTFKVTSDETIGNFIFDLGNKQWNIPELKNILHSVLDSKKLLENYQLKHIFPDIGEKYMLLNARYVISDKGYEAILLVIEDETDKIIKENLLHQQNEKLAVTLLAIGDAVIATDEKGNITLMNKVAELLTGWSQSNALGQPLTKVFNIINEATRKTSKNPVEKVLRTGKICGLANHTILISENGAEIHIDDSGSPIFDTKGKIIGVVLIFKDITEKKKLEEQLFHSEKLAALGQIAAGVAHEFNNILAICSVNSQLLQMTHENVICPNKEETLNGIDNISLAIERGKKIVLNMMNYAKRRNLKKELTDIIEVIENAISFQEKQFELDNIEFEKNYFCSRKIFIDKFQIEQVITNILINARHSIKLRSGKGKIKINIEEKKNTMIIKIQDNGIGMDEETQKKVFDPFFSTKGAYAKNNLGIQGTGLGLSVCLRIIETHDGEIEVQSKKGEGATFKISLPIIDISEKQENSPQIEVLKKKAPPHARKKNTNDEFNILIIDDEKKFLEILAKTLKKLGYKNITTASTGKKAVEFVQQEKFNIIFLDMILPDMSGDEILNAVRIIDKNALVVFISGQVELESEKLLKDKNVFGFIQKPFNISEVIAMISKIKNKK